MNITTLAKFVSHFSELLSIYYAFSKFSGIYEYLENDLTQPGALNRGFATRTQAVTHGVTDGWGLGPTGQ